VYVNGEQRIKSTQVGFDESSFMRYNADGLKHSTSLDIHQIDAVWAGSSPGGFLFGSETCWPVPEVE
jgi:hypothetical protein